MPSKNLAQNEYIEIDIPGDMIGLLAVGVGSGSHASAAVSVAVETYEGTRHTMLLTKVTDDSRVSSLGTGEAGWEACGAWRKLRVTRTDANGGDCFAYLNIR